MQMTCEMAARPGLLMAFATGRGSGYMMRSEKRGYGGSGRRPPRRKRAGFPYIIISIIISVLLWPVGMAMLWRRSVRLQAGTKLLISLLTLCLSVFLIVFALTVPVDNPEYTAFQDRANDWLEKAEKNIAAAGDAVIKKSGETWHVMSDFTRAESDYALIQSADAIDKGVELAGQARASVEMLFGGGKSPKPTEGPVPTPTDEPTEQPTEIATEAPTDAPSEEPTESVTDAPTDEPTESVTDEPTDAPTENVTDAPTDEPTDEPTDAPTEAPTEEPTDIPTEIPTDIPTEAPVDTPEATANGSIDIRLPQQAPDAAAAQALGEGALHVGGAFEPAEVPEETVQPEETQADTTFWTAVEDVTEAPTEEPTEEPTEVPTEEPTEQPTEEPTEAPTEEPTEEPTEAPTEEPTEAPTEEPTEAPPAAPAYTVKPAGEATVYFFENGSKGFHRTPTSHNLNMPAHTLQEAFDLGKSSCNGCGMPQKGILDEEYIAWVDGQRRIHTTDECPAFSGDWKLMSLADAVAGDYEACAECGADAYREAIYPAPTPEPEPVAVTPSMPLRSAGEVTVYFFSGSKGYHVAPECVGMTGAPASTLANAVAEGKKACGNCNPPPADLIGKPVMWMDENGVCHTTDACESFVGKYALILRDDALAQGLPACPDCGAEEYLIPGTVLSGAQ